MRAVETCFERILPGEKISQAQGRREAVSEDLAVVHIDSGHKLKGRMEKRDLAVESKAEFIERSLGHSSPILAPGALAGVGPGVGAEALGVCGHQPVGNFSEELAGKPQMV